MGVLAALKSIVRKNSAGSDFIHRRLNLIEGTNVTLTVADDPTNDEIDVTIAAAGAAGAPSDADYLVGTANAGLSAEIVVGTTPGGELGGSWAAPTVDATHSGSAHHTQSHDHSAAGDGTTLVPESVEISGGPLATRGDISPAQITANQNDYNPTGLADAVVLRLSSDAARDVTGLAGGADGRILTIHNVGSQTITLKDENAGSSAANRFALAADVILAGDDGAVLQYDSTSSRWRCIGSSVNTGGTPADQSITSRMVSLTVSQAEVTTQETTTSTTYTDLTTSGPAVTLSPGVSQDHLIFVMSRCQNSVAATATYASVAIAGATASDNDACTTGATIDHYRMTRITHAAAVADGSTHTMRYRVAGGTGTYSFRRIIGVAL